jgi:hypothetical protein
MYQCCRYPKICCTWCESIPCSSLSVNRELCIKSNWCIWVINLFIRRCSWLTQSGCYLNPLSNAVISATPLIFPVVKYRRIWSKNGTTPFTHSHTHTHTAYILYIYIYMGARGSVVVEALCYKPEGRGIASWWGGIFQIYLILPTALWRTMALGSTQPLTEMSTRNLKKETWG